jgi:hypothetical protein
MIKRAAKKRAAKPSGPGPRTFGDTSVQDVQVSKLNLGIYSWPGIGKTVFWGSGGARTIIMNSDGKGRTASAKAFGSDAKVENITDTLDVTEFYEWFRNDGIDDYDLVVWDSLTLFQDRTLIDDVLQEAHLANPEKQDEFVASQREYLKTQNFVARYVRQFVELPVHFGASFHVSSFEDPEGNIRYCPLMQGGKNQEFSTKIQGYFNVMGYLFVEGGDKHGQRQLRTSPSEDYAAKDDTNTLPAVMLDPTIPSLMDLVSSNGKASKKKAAKKQASQRKGK